MIADNCKRQKHESNWQIAFTEMLPEIRKWLWLAFRGLGPEAREDAIEEGIIHSLLNYHVALQRPCGAGECLIAGVVCYPGRQAWSPGGGSNE